MRTYCSKAQIDMRGKDFDRKEGQAIWPMPFKQLLGCDCFFYSNNKYCPNSKKKCFSKCNIFRVSNDTFLGIQDQIRQVPSVGFSSSFSFLNVCLLSAGRVIKQSEKQLLLKFHADLLNYPFESNTVQTHSPNSRHYFDLHYKILPFNSQEVMQFTRVTLSFCRRN